MKNKTINWRAFNPKTTEGRGEALSPRSSNVDKSITYAGMMRKGIRKNIFFTNETLLFSELLELFKFSIKLDIVSKNVCKIKNLIKLDSKTLKITKSRN
jgi:hypothetical protein